MERVGFVGLGAMGQGMARNLLKAGFAVVGCDRSAQARERFVGAGGVAVDSVEALLGKRPEWIALCLAAEATRRLCEGELLDAVPAGVGIVDHGTLPAPETRRLHGLFAGRGIAYLDVPVSGGPGGAEAGELFLFVGACEGERPELRGYFAAVGHPERIYFGGEPGAGQVMKAVQNMSTWYLDSIRMEILAFGLHSGLSDEALLQATREAGAPGPFTALLGKVRGGNEHAAVGLNAEFDYFLDEARANGFAMPAMRGLMAFLHEQPRDATDVVHRPAHHTWKRFMRTCPERG
jgi:3-hydroxyisobutyrate dehydrogenase-like beta-hydroxyacid dehydrogenase